MLNQMQLSRNFPLRPVIFIGALVALVAVSALFLNNVVATPVSPREAQIRGWVSELNAESLTPARQEAQAQLEAAGAEAVPALSVALRSNDPIVRRNAADMLGFIASPAAVDALSASLGGDPVQAVRTNAAWALGAIKATGGVNALERAAVLDTSAQVRQMAQDALTSVRNEMALRAGRDADKVQALAVAAGEPQTAYLASARDLLVTRDGGASWETLTTTLPSLTSALTVNPTNPQILYAGMHSQGMYLSSDGGRTWESLTRNFSNQAIGESTVTALAVDPANPMHVVMAHGVRIGDANAQFFPLGILASDDGGVTWAYVSELTEGQYVSSLRVNDGKVYALTPEKVLITPLAN